MNENEREQTKSLFECFRPRRKLESESEGSVEKTVKNVTKLSQGLPGLRDTQVMNTPKKSQPSPPPKKASTSNKVGGGRKSLYPLHDTETEWVEARRYGRVQQDGGVVGLGIIMSETSAGSLGSMSDGELLHALDQSESSVVLGGYAGLVKPIEQAEKLGGVAAIVRACSVVYIAYICQNIYIGCIVHRQKSNEEKS